MANNEVYTHYTASDLQDWTRPTLIEHVLRLQDELENRAWDAFQCQQALESGAQAAIDDHHLGGECSECPYTGELLVQAWTMAYDRQALIFQREELRQKIAVAQRGIAVANAQLDKLGINKSVVFEPTVTQTNPSGGK